MEGELEVDVKEAENEVDVEVEVEAEVVAIVEASVDKASHCFGFLQLLTRSIVLICSALHSPSSK